MGKFFLKSKSKRLTCKRKFKIIAKVREHHRKVKKLSKTHDGKKRKKNIGIPNSLPFKEQILQEAMQMKNQVANEKERHFKLMKKVWTQKEMEKSAAKKKLSDKKKQNAVTLQIQEDELEIDLCGVQNANSFYREFRKLITLSDVVLEILDARDPLGSRCLDAEQEVCTMGKKLVLILNKIDLVPREILIQWLSYLRQYYPTFLFKSSNVAHANNHSSKGSAPRMLVHDSGVSKRQKNKVSNTCGYLGVGAVHQFLIHANSIKLTHDNGNLSQNLCVGVIGMPNVGKSSFINALKGIKVCDVGDLPGTTKKCQEIRLERHIRVIDSPGIVTSKPQCHSDLCDVIIRNYVSMDTCAARNLTLLVQHVLQKVGSSRCLMLRYNLADYEDDVHKFLQLLSFRMGRMKKGGAPDANRAARKFLKDWILGPLSYYCIPPEENLQMPCNSVTDAMLVCNAVFGAKDFDAKILKELKVVDEFLDVVLPSSTPLPMCKVIQEKIVDTFNIKEEDDGDDDEIMETDDDIDGNDEDDEDTDDEDNDEEMQDDND